MAAEVTKEGGGGGEICYTSSATHSNDDDSSNKLPGLAAPSTSATQSSSSIVTIGNNRSRIRKRPVSFGNPALGTYHGYVYTLEEQSYDENVAIINNSMSDAYQRADKEETLGKPPLITEGGAISVNRLVAMVDVPPEQVPEGILNLARSHRPWVDHVRIVIGESGSIPYPPVPLPTSSPTEKKPNNKTSTRQNESATVEAAALLSSTFHSSIPISPNAAAAESAASILANEHKQQHTLLKGELEEGDETENNEEHIELTYEKNDHQHVRRLNSENGNHNNNKHATKPDRTYLALIEMSTESAATQFVNDLHNQPYTILDETDTCSVYRVVAVAGEDGVSVMSPFFAAPAARASKTTSTTTSISKSTTEAATGAANSCSSSSTTSTTTTPPSVEETTASQPPPYIDDHYNCAVCLERIDLDNHSGGVGGTHSGTVTSSTSHTYHNNHGLRLGSPPTHHSVASSSILTTVCNHSFHLDCLLQWQDSPCPVCRYDHSGLNDALSQCHVCGTTENNYVCLICGVVSCGWESNNGIHRTEESSSSQYEESASGATASAEASAIPKDTRNDSNFQNKCSILDEDFGTMSLESSSYPLQQLGIQQQQYTGRNSDHSRHMLCTWNSHARQHYDQTLHAYALNTETQHVWDFAGGGYVHRLLQSEDDGKLVEVNDPNNLTSKERSLNPGLADAQEGEVVHRKLEGFASQYYTLLKSQLEQQRIYYEGRLAELRREYGIKDNDNNRARTTAATAAVKKKKKESADLITALKQERSQLRHRLHSLKSRQDKVKEDVSFLINMNESLEANKIPLRQQLDQAQSERMEQKKLFEECIIPPLQERVTHLMLQLENNFGSSNNNNSEDYKNEDDKKLPARRNI